MSALPLPGDDRPSPRRPHRPRSGLVPLGDQDTSTGTWYLGADGRTAHLPAPPLTGPRGTLRLVPGDAAIRHDDLSLCAVFLSQIPAGGHVEHCTACLQLRSPPTPGIRGIVT